MSNYHDGVEELFINDGVDVIITHLLCAPKEDTWGLRIIGANCEGTAQMLSWFAFIRIESEIDRSYAHPVTKCIFLCTSLAKQQCYLCRIRIGACYSSNLPRHLDISRTVESLLQILSPF